MRSLRANAPDVVFLGFESVAGAQRRGSLSGEGSAGRSDYRDPPDAGCQRVEGEHVRLGVREFLFDPFERASLTESLRNVGGAPGDAIRRDTRLDHADAFRFSPPRPAWERPLWLSM